MRLRDRFYNFLDVTDHKRHWLIVICVASLIAAVILGPQVDDSQFARTAIIALFALVAVPLAIFMVLNELCLPDKKCRRCGKWFNERDRPAKCGD